MHGDGRSRRHRRRAALNAGVTARDIDVRVLQKTLRAQGADPGDQTGPNADVPALAAYVRQAETA